MAENTTTLLEKWEKQHQDHPEWTPALEDILYVIHGTGRDRDRLYSLDEVLELVSTSFDSIHMSKDGSTVDADGKELKYKVVGQGQGSRTMESIVDSLGLLAKVYGIGSARYQSNRITFYDEEDNEVVKLEFDPVVGLIVKDAEGNEGVLRAGTFNGTDVVASGMVKSYTGANRPSTSQYFELGPMGLVLNSGPGQSSSNLVIEGNSGSNGYNVSGLKDVSANGKITADGNVETKGWFHVKSSNGNDIVSCGNLGNRSFLIFKSSDGQNEASIVLDLRDTSEDYLKLKISSAFGIILDAISNARYKLSESYFKIDSNTDLTSSTFCNDREVGEVVYLANDNNAPYTITINGSITKTLPANSLITAMYMGNNKWVAG